MLLIPAGHRGSVERMKHTRRWVAILGCALVVAALAVGCSGSSIGPQATGSRTPIPRVDITPTPSATPGPLPMPTTPPASAAVPPSGDDRSCAASHPWGRPVTSGFVCVDGPPEVGDGLNGRRVNVRGFAGGAPNDQLFVEWQVRSSEGRLSPEAPARTLWSFSAPAPGQPGGWVMSIDQASNVAGSTLVFTAVMQSADDVRIAESKLEVPIR